MMLDKEEVREKLSKGWIKSRMWFEVMAVDKGITEKTLRDHVEKVKKVKDSYIISEKFEDAIEVQNPPNKVKQAFSQAVQTEILAKDIETLLFIVIFYAPSAVEILEPKEFKIGMETVQTVMNSVADVIHRFAAGGAGGIIISAKR